jgi:mono/diheme cytochrome c family protein
MTVVTLQQGRAAGSSRYSLFVRTVLIPIVTVAVVGAWGPWAIPPRSPQALPGWQAYDKFCLACHGAAGDGRGPAAPYTRGLPRDFTRGELKWRDLKAAIRYGAPDTSMPAFALPDADIDALADVVRAFGAEEKSRPALSPYVAGTNGAELWAKLGCTACHGKDGSGAVAAYDLRKEQHRPRATDDREGRRMAAALSIAGGVPGTAMPSYAGTASDADIWALADFVVAMRIDEKRDRSTMDAAAIARDKTPVAVWPGTGDEAKLFGGPIALQGAPPPQLAPAEASLHPNQCARCHAKQFREWEPTIHHGATSPGLAAQMWGMSKSERADCLRCHAPLPEQLADDTLYADGVLCAGCHVRGWTRHGPPNVSPSLMPINGYPLETLAIYERGDFCLPCHQLPTRTEVAGKPLLNTYKEWLEGPYMRRGVQCQHCHMPNREHTFKGVHDAQTFREGIALRTDIKVGTAITVTAELENIGAGHYLPTTPTPAAWLSIALLDAKAKPLAQASQRIGRDIYYDTQWHERADTRIPPGEKLVFARSWNLAGAVTARVTVEVHPDDYYERLYASQLQAKLPPERRKLYEAALARARSRHYVAEQRDIAIAPTRPHDGPP